MNDPERWLEQGGSSLEVALLRAARADAPAARAKERALEALGLATDVAPKAGAGRTEKGASSKPPPAQTVLFESVLGVGDRRAGLFTPGGGGLPVLVAVAAAAAFWAAVPQRPPPAGFRGIEVAVTASPVPKADKPAVAPAHDPPRHTEPRSQRLPLPASDAIAERGQSADAPPDGNAELPASDQGHEPAPLPLLAGPSSDPPETLLPVQPPANTLTVLPFGSGMTRPVLISGRAPVYTREALAARVEGTVQVRCTITAQGTLTHCRVQQSVPWMDQAVLDAMATRRYQPVTYQGRPISVDYVFTIRLVLPK